MKRIHLRDRRDDRPGVETGSTKFAGKDWPWFWVWAAPNESRDPRTGIVRRHHVHTLGKALAVAVKRCGCDRRVTQHSLRHSFATTLLDRGIGIHVVSQLLGHAHISTTEIYAHVLPRQAVVQAASPMDLAPGNVLPVQFAAPAETSALRIHRRA